MDFSGKAVLITGSSTGIGRASALEFAKRGASYIGINYLRSKKDPGDAAEETKNLVEAAGGQAVIFEGDVSAENTAAALVDSFYKEFGRIDILANCAGTTKFIDFADLDALTTDVWQKIMSTNLYGPFFLIRAAAKIMKAQGSGSIVNVSSLAALTTQGSSIPYNMSKTALMHLTRCLVGTLAPEVRINCILPGTVSDSNWFAGNADGETFKKAIHKGGENVPLDRDGKCIDYAKAICFFASEQAEYCTGSCLVVDGGIYNK
ncbi:MAG: SDR family oxidoreductase [Clostridiales Family XIII bacterium]|jgi:3-oxoacyl-[acyl-carrier protein] reductase|nr:SDR family oxidoreductase [Clostridiales Family XIII bacterium]